MGNTPSIDRVGWKGLCLEDLPLGFRDTDECLRFPAGINVAATFDKELAYQRGYAMGQEFRGKGVNVALGPGNEHWPAPNPPGTNIRPRLGDG